MWKSLGIAALALLVGEAHAQPNNIYAQPRGGDSQSVAQGGLSASPMSFQLFSVGSNAPLFNTQVALTITGDCGFESGVTTVTTNVVGIGTTPRIRAGSTVGRCSVYVSAPGGVFPVGIGSVRVYNPAELRIVVNDPPRQVNTFQTVAFIQFIEDSTGVLPDLRPTLSATTDPATGATADNLHLFEAGTIGGPPLVGFTGNEFPGAYSIILSYGSASTRIQVTQVSASPQMTQLYGTTATGERFQAFVNGDRCGFASGRFVEMASAGLTPPANLSFPFGLLDFRIMGCASGVRPTLSIRPDFGSIPPTATFWVHGPTVSKPEPHWHQLPAVSGDASTVLSDGGDGDSDLAANGAIKAIGGIAFPNGIHQDLWWSGPAQNGWGLSIIEHRDILFANLFVYGAGGKPTWFVMPGGSWNAARTEFTGAMFQPRGAPFYAYDASRHVIGPQLGTVKLTFNGPSLANLEYNVGAAHYSKQIERPAFGPYDEVLRPARGDLWWGGPQQNGWGLAVLQQQGTLFTLWFTYDSEGLPTWYAMPNGSWTAADTYEGSIYSTVGSPYATTYRVADHKVTEVGSFRFRFSGDTATFRYSIDGMSDTLSLTKIPF